MKWYLDDLVNVVKALSSDEKNGLSKEQVVEQRKIHGENKLEGKKHKTFIQKFLAQLNNYMVMILIFAAVISFIVALLSHEGEFIDSIIIIMIVVLNAVLGVVQESNAEKALDALKNMSAPNAKVVRGGSVKQIPASELVPGDVILLESGDLVPADARLIESASLKSEESVLTGESVPVDKDSEAVVADNAPLGDRRNLVYSGCSISYGRGRAVVVSTGMNTEMGKIAGLLNNEKEELTPLQHKLNVMGKYLGVLAIIICVIIFGIGLLYGEELIVMFMTAVSLAVAAIPEGLTAVVTIVLAIGVQKMVKHNAIIRKLPAVETLGGASVICSDKTGTLTQNKMTVQKVWAVGETVFSMGEKISEDARLILKYGTLCNDGKIEVSKNGEQRSIGDPTETAIVAAALAEGMAKNDLDTKFKRVAEIPFDSNRKLMTTVNIIDGTPVAVVKGGFDVLLPRCVNPDVNKAQDVNMLMAEDALRVLAVGYKKLSAVPENPTSDELENGLTFMGLIGMIDPPREESKSAVEVCKKAGIQTVMITGDHVLTASAIAKQIGILDSGREAISGTQLASMSDDELRANVARYAVYARVSPEDKIRIVKAWQANGQVVSMTGDGVNDAPALKAADIGCAMGITGTDVSKGAADMILTDDNFSTIVEAVRQGRGIYDNIKKTVEFLLGSNLGEVVTVFVAMILGMGSPLLAIHLLLINVVTDTFPALALGVEGVETDIMQRKPLPKNEGIFANGLGVKIALQGVLFALITLTGYYVGSYVGIGGIIEPSHEVGQSMAFLVLSLSQVVHAFNCRSRRSLFKIGFFSNLRMVQAPLVSITIIMIIALVPAVQNVFKITDLSSGHWLLVAGLSISPLIVLEIAKIFIKNE